MIVKLRMKILILMGSLMLLVFALNLGIASADEPHDSGGGIARAEENGAGAPVGSNISDEGRTNGFGGGPGSGVRGDAAIANNPLCPAHPE